ncbi:MAG TPA: hypothetical protein VD793_02150 [Gemmatimonadales bacterium]|nr:hypothetical protein [Gemmatimonadales bacterium]
MHAMTRWSARLALLVIGARGLPAQHVHEMSPYAGMVSRDIKALSEEQVAQYQNGEGMGLALAAELNSYPGPRHALELAGPLELTAAQHVAVSGIQVTMERDARRLGGMLVEQERKLDRAFAGGTIDDATLTAHTAVIGRLQGELRLVHLRAHIGVRRLLTPEQVQIYNRLRGYPGG